jgi:hypothetical protein
MARRRIFEAATPDAGSIHQQFAIVAIDAAMSTLLRMRR